jgi:hypothetical protein
MINIELKMKMSQNTMSEFISFINKKSNPVLIILDYCNILPKIIKLEIYEICSSS